MTRAAANRPSDSAWGAELLRFTYFHPLKSANVTGLWKELTGHDPDTATTKPKTGVSSEIGKYEGSQLILQSQKERTDWIMLTGEEPGRPPAPFPDRATIFLNLMNKWLDREDLPAAARLALGVIVLRKVPDVVTGYRTLTDYLNFVVDESISGDFLYQANRKRDLKAIPDVEVNRLCKWNVEDTSIVLFQVSGEGVKSQPTPEQLGPSARIELDINTSPKPDLLLPKEQLKPVLHELIELAREIIREGDIP